MIPKKMVDRYAHQSGLKDQLVAEREVVLTYALHAMREKNGARPPLSLERLTLRRAPQSSANELSSPIGKTALIEPDRF